MLDEMCALHDLPRRVGGPARTVVVFGAWHGEPQPAAVGGVGRMIVLWRQPHEVAPEVTQMIERLPGVVAPIAPLEAEAGCHLAEDLAGETPLDAEERHVRRPPARAVDRLHPALAAVPRVERLIVNGRREGGALREREAAGPTHPDIHGTPFP